MWSVGLAALRHVGSQLPSRGWNLQSFTGRWILNPWTTRGGPVGCLLACILCGLMSDINWGKFPVVVWSISSVLCSLSSPAGISIKCVAPFRVAPQPLNILLCFLVSVFFAFHLRGFYWEILTLRDPFLSCVQPTNEPIRDILHPCKVFSFSSISFWFFLRISISLLTLPLCFCMLIILSIRAPNILIIVILNSWTDNANIPAMSNSDAWSVSSDFCLLGWFVSFFLIAGDDVPGRRNCWAFSDMRGSCGHMRTFL